VDPHRRGARPVESGELSVLELLEQLSDAFGFVRRSVPRWPAGAISAAGSALTLVAVVTELILPQRFGVTEYVATLLSGVALMLAGPLVFAQQGRDAAQQLAKTLDSPTISMKFTDPTQDRARDR
jgi:hypothetical protein